MTQDQHNEENTLREALRRAFSLGQTYWRQADSDSYKLNAKADETLAQFAEFVETTVAHLQQRPLPVREGTERDAARYRWLRDTGYWYTSPNGSPWAVFGTGAGDASPCCGRALDAAIDAGMADMPPVAPSLPVREEPTPVLNALQVLERMDYRPGDRVLVEHFLSVLWARGMWVIESPLASSPSVQNRGEGETGKDGVLGTFNDQPKEPR